MMTWPLFLVLGVSHAPLWAVYTAFAALTGWDLAAGLFLKLGGEVKAPFFALLLNSMFANLLRMGGLLAGTVGLLLWRSM